MTTDTAATVANLPDTTNFMIDAKGRHVPVHLVSDLEKLQDQLVTNVMNFAISLSAQIARFKTHTFDDVDTYMSLSAEKYGAKRRGQKGNMKFQSYNGCMRLIVAVQDHLDFGPELQTAKALVDECISEWASEASDKIKKLVSHAFDVDKAGRINREALFSLRRLQIDDPRWKSAMEAIADSMRIAGSKTYIRLYQRATATDDWLLVPIDLAAV